MNENSEFKNSGFRMRSEGPLPPFWILTSEFCILNS